LFTRILAALVGPLVIVALICGCTANKTPAAPSSSASAAVSSGSDEDQVRNTFTAFQSAFDKEDWNQYLQLMCPSMRAQYTESVLDQMKQAHSAQGTTQATVKAVTIAGDTATATVEFQDKALGLKTVHIKFVRADGWKVCETGAKG
jgi:predicted lipid-binding transport protein (Tim44 family)